MQIKLLLIKLWLILKNLIRTLMQSLRFDTLYMARFIKICYIASSYFYYWYFGKQKDHNSDQAIDKALDVVFCLPKYIKIKILLAIVWILLQVVFYCYQVFQIKRWLSCFVTKVHEIKREFKY